MLTDRLYAAGPKRILSLDGGGVRGVLSLAFLERIEALLRARTGRADLTLSNYYDLIGGTSTGAIIAVTLAMGFSVSELIELYLTLAQKSFRRKISLRAWSPKFDSAALREVLHSRLGHETLGSDRLQTGIGVVSKRLDTGSVWIFHNHPRGPYFSSQPGSTATPNRDLLLIDILRASTAAPTYFAPELIITAQGQRGLFVDGAVSPHNNPALMLLMLATQHGYGFRWPMGGDRLLLTSVGTGSPAYKPTAPALDKMPSIFLAAESLLSIMHDCNALVQTMMQWISDSPTASHIDSEVGDLGKDVVAGNPLVHYLRYDTPLEPAALSLLGFALTPSEAAAIRQIDRPDAVDRLLEIGRVAAERQVKAEHFPFGFDAGA